MKIAFYNLENLFLGDGLPFGTHRKSEEKTQSLAQVILDINPDIIGLCEVGGRQSLLKFSKNYLNNQYHFSFIEGNSDRNIHLGYLIKKTLTYKFEQLTHRNRPLHFWYPKEASRNKEAIQQGKKPPFKSELLCRDIAELRVLDQENKVKYIILTVHLKSQLDKEGKDWRGLSRRRSEIKLLIDTYKILNKRYSNIPIFVMGDFNARIDDIEQNEFLYLKNQTSLRDVHDYINSSIQERVTWMGINKNQKTVHCQMDYIFIDSKFSNLIDKENSGSYRYRSEDGNILPLPQTTWEKHPFPSDHLPIVLNLKDKIEE